MRFNNLQYFSRNCCQCANFTLFYINIGTVIGRDYLFVVVYGTAYFCSLLLNCLWVAGVLGYLGYCRPATSLHDYSC